MFRHRWRGTCLDSEVFTSELQSQTRTVDSCHELCTCAGVVRRHMKELIFFRLYLTPMSTLKVHAVFYINVLGHKVSCIPEKLSISRVHRN